MDRLWYTLPHYIYRRFKLFWILITLIVLLLCSYITWHSNINNTYSQVSETANTLANNLDNFINGVFADVSSLPVYEKKKLSCQKDFIPFLRHIIINHPKISGIAIHDIKHQLMCSTLPHNKSFLLAEKKTTQGLLGPLNLPMFDHPIFSMKRKMGNYHVEIIIVSPMLENILKNTKGCMRSVVLYDQNRKKSIIDITRPKQDSWIYNKLISYQLPLTAKPILATTKLRALDGVSVTVTKCNQTLFHGLWYNQILLGIDILVISCFLYCLIRNLLRKHYSLVWAIKKAIKNKRFYPVYQPLYNIKTNKFSGAEVLLRWKNSDGEIIMPDCFIKEAEDTGLIIPITLQIIEIAFKEAKVILNSDSKFHLSFNISALHFTHPSFFDQFYQLIIDYTISPVQILLEITERDLLDQNNEIYIKKMQELQEKGFSLAVDDYGTGHASISYLQYFPFNYLKIDKLFIQAIGTKAITESLNDAIIDLAKKINLIIIAEGVETKEQVNYLQKNGIELLQGWYFSKAVAIEQLKTLLRGENI